MDKISSEDAIRYALGLYDGTGEQLSKALDRSRGFISSYMATGRTPSIALYARILGRSGHRLAVIDDGGEPIATIEPPEHQEPSH